MLSKTRTILKLTSLISGISFVLIGSSAFSSPQPLNRISTPARTIPAPEQLQSPSAIAIPVNGRINVRVHNLTNTSISYEVIGQTNQRLLSARSQYVLRDLSAPTTITFRRPDGGLLNIQPFSRTPGLLEVSLIETSNFSQDNISMRVQQNGSVFLN